MSQAPVSKPLETAQALLREPRGEDGLKAKKRWNKWGTATSKKGMHRGTKEGREALREEVKQEMIRDLAKNSQWRFQGTVWNIIGHGVERWKLEKDDGLVKALGERWQELELMLKAAASTNPQVHQGPVDRVLNMVHISQTYGRVLVQTQSKEEMVRLMQEYTGPSPMAHDFYPLLNRILASPLAWEEKELIEKVYLALASALRNVITIVLMKNWKGRGKPGMGRFPLWWVLGSCRVYMSQSEFRAQLREVLEGMETQSILGQWGEIDKYAPAEWELILKERPSLWKELSKTQIAKLIGNPNKEVRLLALKLAGKQGISR